MGLVTIARAASKEEAIWGEIMLTDVEASPVACRIADIRRAHGEESPEFHTAVEEATPFFEQGMERYMRKRAKEEARRMAGVR